MSDAEQKAPTPQNKPHTDRSEVDSREMQYMVGRRPTSALSPLANTGDHYDSQRILEALETLQDITVVRLVKQSSLSVLTTTSSARHDIIVVRTAAQERAEYLNSLMRQNPALIVERDHLLQHLGAVQPQRAAGVSRNPTQISTATTAVRFHVADESGTPVAQADIVVYGNSGSEDRGKTDSAGNATIEVSESFLNQVSALYVKPAANYWEKFIERPSFNEGTVNTVTLQPLAAFGQAGFPGQQGDGPFLGWGQRVMGLLKLDCDTMEAFPVRVAIIDSGCDTSHPALSHITRGRDYTKLDANHEPDATTWRDDQVSHGTHCAGVIAGNGKNGHIRGFVPNAEIHILKVFPGGAFNNLVAAINYCIDNQIHVANCSLGGEVSSELVAHSIERARNAGVAMFVAAGNSANAVQFPASISGVLCVSALGQAGNFPDYTYHARTVPDGAIVTNGQVYPAKFTCHGPQVSACAPGVGIISSVPGGGYAAWDGTSMADPHLTGLGALLATYHPDVAGVQLRDSAWVDRLFGLVLAAAQPVGISPDYAGVGLPIASTLFDDQAMPKAPGPQPDRPVAPDLIAELTKALISALPTGVTGDRIDRRGTNGQMQSGGIAS